MLRNRMNVAPRSGLVVSVPGVVGQIAQVVDVRNF